MQVASQAVSPAMAEIAHHAFDAPSVMEQARHFPPFLNLDREPNHPYPRALTRLVEMALLQQKDCLMDAEYFQSLTKAMETSLQSLRANSSKETFWGIIRATRARLDLAHRDNNSDSRRTDRTPPWLSNYSQENQVITRRQTEPKRLGTLATNCITHALHDGDDLANDALVNQVALVFSLLHLRIGEFTHAVKACRPDLWMISGNLDPDVAFHVRNALALCDKAEADHDRAHLDMIDINHALFWASYYIRGMDCSQASPPLTDSEMLAAMAIENVQHRIATLFGPHH